MEIAIILPAYNEAKTIGSTLRDFHRALPAALLCVVDNNSTDGTAEAARATAAALPSCRFLLLAEKRQGKAFAMRRAFTLIEADAYVMSDADSTYSASDLAPLLAPVLADEADMVVGDRHAQGHYRRENKRPLHNFGNSLVKALINRLFGVTLHDILSGYRVFSRTFVKSFPVLTAGFELETEITLHAVDKRFRIVELPISYQDRPAGNFSKLSTFRDGRKVLTALFSILRYNRPLLFFGGIAGVFAAFGLAIGSLPVVEYYHTGLILHIPSAILASGLMVCAVTTSAIALILDSVAHMQRHDSELRLIELEAARRRRP
ncbi:Glycosyltransferase involved in cell wall bisynthesis [Opitutus sp. GAS368]|jgi:glycosyltransferase involved in cell wall biosynthesis|nr:Glycosyltransferase involved in cell wall bisynthesis [Opitutus sp. GAS368]